MRGVARVDLPVATDLLWSVLTRNSSMHKVAQCVAVAEADGRGYPVADVDRLVSAFDRYVGHSSRLAVDDCVITRQAVVDELSGAAPCAADREELVTILLVAFETARLRELGLGDAQHVRAAGELR